MTDPVFKAEAAKRLSVYLPEELQPYKDDLEFFVSLMVRKLHTNRHKGVGVDLNPVFMLEAAEHEIAEGREAIRNKGQFEAATECADVANFAFLAAMASLSMTREDFKAVAGRLPKAHNINYAAVAKQVMAPNGEDQQ